jgi:hypothetical protein
MHKAVNVTHAIRTPRNTPRTNNQRTIRDRDVFVIHSNRTR